MESGELLRRNDGQNVQRHHQSQSARPGRNSDIANSLVSAYKRNVIGAGYNLQAKTKNAKLNADIEKLWKKWCKARNCDVTGTQTLNQMLRMAVTRKKVDGGILFVKVYTNDGMTPFKLQMIELMSSTLSRLRDGRRKPNRRRY